MKIVITCLAALMMMTGCRKFLDKQPLSTLSPDNYYKTESEVNTALNGVYNILALEAMWGSQIEIRQNASTDESWFSYTSFPTGVFWYNYDPSDAYVLNMWTNCYAGIERANVLLSHLDGASMDSTKKLAVRGETLFLRAFYFYTLAQYFGDVPLKLTPSASVNNVNLARTPVKEVYTQVLKDMQEAEGLVLTADVTGNTERISKSTVQGILARVCLTMAGQPLNDATKYSEALSWAQKVVSSGLHKLDSSYQQIFINECQDIDDWKECIWETGQWGNNSDVNRIGGRIGNENGVKCSSSDPANVGYAYGFISATYKLYHLYDAADTRRDWAISNYTLNASGVKAAISASTFYIRNCAKWRREYELDKPMNKNYTPTNFPMLRYSDVLLMEAEAENEVNGPTQTAYDAINQVRRRGHGFGLDTVSVIADAPSGLSKDDFRKYLQDERARELCFEGLRKPDLIRWGLFLTSMQDQVTEFATRASSTYQYAGQAAGRVSQRHLLYPIPTKEMSLNKSMTQNPGW